MFPFEWSSPCGAEHKPGEPQGSGWRSAIQGRPEICFLSVAFRLRRRSLFCRNAWLCERSPAQSRTDRKSIPFREPSARGVAPLPKKPQALACGVDRKICFLSRCLNGIARCSEPSWAPSPEIAAEGSAGRKYISFRPPHAAGRYGSGEPLSLVRACSHDSTGWARPRSEISLSVSR